MVELESMKLTEDKRLLKELIERHYKWTDSKQAERILSSWQDMLASS